jgi:hypothetical protein
MSGAGKGDKNRSDPQKYAAGWSHIFDRCPDHPKYTAKCKPRCECIRCWEIWRRKNGD